jgi:hypothetical protein
MSVCVGRLIPLHEGNTGANRDGLEESEPEIKRDSQ